MLLPLSSFSNSYTFGYTGNAASGGNTWNMSSSVLGIDVQDGLDISGVIYTYLPVKNVVDDFTVTVQAKHADTGFIFQDTEDWSGLPAIRIKKALALPYTPVSLFGESAIVTTGTGTIEDASVIYMYRFDTCYDPQNDPGCPGYIPPVPKIPKIDFYDALEDEFVEMALEETDNDLIEDKEMKETDEEEEDEERLEVAFAATSNALTIANTATQASVLDAINKATNFNSYYIAQIPGKIYQETIVLPDARLPDNRKVFRSLAKDTLMNQMIEEQYK